MRYKGNGFAIFLVESHCLVETVGHYWLVVMSENKMMLSFLAALRIANANQAVVVAEDHVAWMDGDASAAS